MQDFKAKKYKTLMKELKKITALNILTCETEAPEGDEQAEEIHLTSF